MTDNAFGVIENNPIDDAIQQVMKKTPSAYWVTEGALLENFALLNGVPSLSSLYYYPQSSIWKDIGPGDQSFIYNRYANVSFEFLDTGSPNYTQLQLSAGDHYIINTNVCSSFLQKNHVEYFLATSQLTSSCISTLKRIILPGGTFYIYKDMY